MKRTPTITLGVVSLLLIIIASCFASNRAGSGPLSGRVSLWHAWSGLQAEALDAVLASFLELNPNVTVRQQSFSSLEEMQRQYLSTAASGLGPDLILAPSSWLHSTTSAIPMDAIDDDIVQAVLDRTMPGALTNMRRDGELVGVPLALDVAALYYHRARVETPPATLDDLLAQAEDGQTVLIPTNFYDSFWGVPAFGGKLFDDSGRTILDQGGFANWLAWLKDAREIPSVILDGNRSALLARFLAGEAGYYVGYAGELSAIQQALGADAVGVSALPSGPVGSAGPFLGVDGFFFSPVSSANQRRLALALAQFISNTEQSGYLMRTIQMVPANTRVRINPRLNPIVAGFSAQARSAVPIPDRPDMETVFALGTDGVNRALEGDMTPAEVAMETSNAINAATGFPLTEVSETACTSLGTIRLAHSWEGLRASALDDLIAAYDRICPLVIIDREAIVQDALQPRLAGEHLAGLRPTFVLASQAALPPLFERSLLENITGSTNNATLQKFWPVALDTMRIQDSLYGLPVELTVDVLYYNPRLVDTPAAILDELRRQASQGVPIRLDISFTKAFWGIGAFGGRLFDSQFRVILDQGGMAEWLTWLAESRAGFGIGLTDDSDELLAQFLAGETAYYVGSSTEFNTLQEALGPGALGVALLPSGPSGGGRPLVSAYGFVFRDTASATAMTLAQDFARFFTDAESQAHLMQTAHIIPANATVDLSRDPALVTFAEQIRAGLVTPNHPYWNTVREMGNDYYRAVLDGGEDPALVVETVTRQINEANGVAPLPTPEAAPSPAEPVTAPVTATASLTLTAPLSDTEPLTASDRLTNSLAPSATVPAGAPVLPGTGAQ